MPRALDPFNDFPIMSMQGNFLFDENQRVLDGGFAIDVSAMPCKKTAPFLQKTTALLSRG